MKLSSVLLAQAVYSKTDVHFNHDHDVHQVAQLEKWNALAQKWFNNHGDDLRKQFRTRWSGSNGRFQREIKKLEQSFSRKCSTKTSTPEWNKDTDDADLEVQKKKRRSDESSDDDLTIVHNSGVRILHIVHNIEHWIEAYLKNCHLTSKKIVHRWGRFVDKWESEIAKNPIFQEEIEEEERFLRQQNAAAERTGRKPCGALYSEFGLHGRRFTIYDASNDPSYGIEDLGDHPLGNDELMSVRPYPGCYIRSYQHVNKEGYSSVCDKQYGCAVVNDGTVGALPENEASSVYCYCDEPTPKTCAWLFDWDSNRWESGRVEVKDGFQIGMEYSMDAWPVYIEDDDLSAIQVHEGCKVEIWKHRNKGEPNFTCDGTNGERECHSNELGPVGNQETSSIKCTCPKKSD